MYNDDDDNGSDFIPNTLPATGDQKIFLLEYMESNVGFSQDGPDGRTTFKTTWKHLAQDLNSIRGGVFKSVDQWQKYWNSQRAGVKKRARSAAEHVRGTGGGPPPNVQHILTSYDNRVLACMGGWKRVFGIRGVKDPLRINPQTLRGSTSFASSSRRDKENTRGRGRSPYHEERSSWGRGRSPGRRTRSRSRGRSPYHEERSSWGRGRSPGRRTRSRSRGRSPYHEERSSWGRGRSPGRRTRSRGRSPYHEERSSWGRGRSPGRRTRSRSRGRSPHHEERSSWGRGRSPGRRTRSRSRGSKRSEAKKWEPVPDYLLQHIPVDEDGWEVPDDVLLQPTSEEPNITTSTASIAQKSNGTMAAGASACTNTGKAQILTPVVKNSNSSIAPYSNGSRAAGTSAGTKTGNAIILTPVVKNSNSSIAQYSNGTMAACASACTNTGNAPILTPVVKNSNASFVTVSKIPGPGASVAGMNSQRVITLIIPKRSIAGKVETVTTSLRQPLTNVQTNIMKKPKI